MPIWEDYGTVDNKERGWRIKAIPTEDGGTKYVLVSSLEDLLAEIEFLASIENPQTGSKKIKNTPYGKAEIVRGDPYDEPTAVIPLTSEEASKLIEKQEELPKPEEPRDTKSERIFDSENTQGTGPPPPCSSSENEPITEKQRQPDDSFTTNKTGGDPIVLFSGQFYHQVIDLEVKGRGLHFSFKRTYLNQTMYKGPLGYNWDHSYNLWLREEQRILPDGILQNVVYRSTGQLREDPYIQDLKTATGDLPPLSEFTDAIFQPPIGFFERLEKSNGRYVIETATGVRFEYNNDLRIDRIVDLNGNVMSFIYDPDSQLLTTITDPVGKEFHLKYDEMNRILILHDITADRTISYHYGDNGDLEEVDLLLEPGVFTGTDYRYLGSNYPFELQHNLTEIIRFTGESVMENEYGISPGMPEFSRVVRQRSADGEYRYEYENIFDPSVDPAVDPINVPLILTRVFYPNDHCIEYRFNNQGNAVQKSEQIILSGGSGMPTQLVYTYRYNEDALLIEEVLPNKASMEYRYQRDFYADLHEGDFSAATPSEKYTFGNLLKRVERPRIGVGEERCIVTEYTYYTQGNRIKSVIGPYYAGLVLLNPVQGQIIYEISYQYDEKGNLTTIIYPDVYGPDGTNQPLASMIIKYDSHGLVTDVIRGPLHIQYIYFPDLLRSGFVEEVIEDADAIKIRTHLEVDDIGRVTKITDHYGAVTEIEWTSFDTLKRVTLPHIVPGTDRPTVTYKYDRNRQLTDVVEDVKLYDGTSHHEDSLIHKFVYDAYGRVVEKKIGSLAKPDKRKWLTVYTQFNRIEREIDPLGNITRFKYNELMLTSSIIRGYNTKDETTRQIVYNEVGCTVTLVDGRGFQSVMGYDAFSRPNVIQDPDGNKTVLEYDPSDNVILRAIYGTEPETGKINVRWSETEFRYDSAGRLITKIDHLFIPGIEGSDSLLETKFFYDTQDRLKTIIGPGNVVTDYEFDGLGRVIYLRDSDGNETEWRFNDDPDGHLLTVLTKDIGFNESNKLVTQFFQSVIKYDTRSLPVEEIDGLGNITKRGFDSRQLLSWYFVSANNHEFFIDYDIFGQLISTKTNLDDHQTSTHMEYNDNGLISKAVSPIGGISKWNYDNLNRISQIEHVGSGIIKYYYDKESNLVLQQDENGVAIRGFYTSAGFLQQEIPDLSNFLTLPNLPSYVPSNTLASTLKHTPIGNLAIVQNHDISLKLYYDSLGRVIEEVSNGKSIQYRYDELGRQIGFRYPDGRDISYEYSSAGSLIGIVQNSMGSPYPGDTSLPESRPLASILRIGDRPLVYMLANQMATLSYDPRMSIVGIDWSSISNGVKILTERNLYGSLYERKIQQLDDSLRLLNYDEMSRLISALDKDGVNTIDVSHLAPAASKSGLLTAPDQKQIDSVILSLENQTSGLVSQRSFVYRLDDNNNRLETATTLSANGVVDTTIYVPDNQDRYQSIGGTAVIYDNVGNLLRDGINSYHYDAYNRITEVSTVLGKNEISYDSIGRIIRVQDYNNLITGFTYAGSRLIEWSSNGILTGQVVPLDGPNQYAHLATKGSDFSPVFNSIDTILGWTKTDGSILFGKCLYDPFGQILQQDDESPAAFGFAGYWYDNKSGIYELLARSYDPRLGRFLQRDPMGLVDGFNLYGYVHHAPGTFTDNWGMSSEVTADRDWGFILREGAKSVAKTIGGALIGAAQSANAIQRNDLLELGEITINTWRSLLESYQKKVKEASDVGRTGYNWQAAAAAAVAGDAVLPFTSLSEVIDGRNIVSGKELSDQQIGEKGGFIVGTAIIAIVAKRIGGPNAGKGTTASSFSRFRGSRLLDIANRRLLRLTQEEQSAVSKSLTYGESGPSIGGIFHRKIGANRIGSDFVKHGASEGPPGTGALTHEYKTTQIGITIEAAEDAISQSLRDTFDIQRRQMGLRPIRRVTWLDYSKGIKVDIPEIINGPR